MAPTRLGDGTNIDSIRLGDGTVIDEVRTGDGQTVFTSTVIPDTSLTQSNWGAGADVITLSFTLGSGTLEITGGESSSAFATGNASFVGPQVGVNETISIQCDVANSGGNDESTDFAIGLCESSDGSNLIVGAGGRYNIDVDDKNSRIYDFRTGNPTPGSTISVNSGQVYTIRVEISPSGTVTYFRNGVQINSTSLSSFNMSTSYFAIYQENKPPNVDFFENFGAEVV